MHEPEMDVRCYRSWMQEGWYDRVLEKLGHLAEYCEWVPVHGVDVGGLRDACFRPFEAEWNREVFGLLKRVEDTWARKVPVCDICGEIADVEEDGLYYCSHCLGRINAFIHRS